MTTPKIFEDAVLRHPPYIPWRGCCVEGCVSAWWSVFTFSDNFLVMASILLLMYWKVNKSEYICKFTSNCTKWNFTKVQIDVDFWKEGKYFLTQYCFVNLTLNVKTRTQENWNCETNVLKSPKKLALYYLVFYSSYHLEQKCHSSINLTLYCCSWDLLPFDCSRQTNSYK